MMNTQSLQPEMSAPAAENDPLLDGPLVLRAELKFDARDHEAQSFVVIEDPVRSKYFQVGAKEYRFLASLDGVKTPRDIINELNAAHARESIDEDSVARQQASDAPYDEHAVRMVCQWLIQSNLGFAPGMDNAKRLNQQATAMKRAKLIGLINPISFKFKLFNPNRLLAMAQPLMQWMFSRWFFVVWLAVGLWACFELVNHWEQLGAASTGILAGSSWIWLLATWFLLKVIHEAAHGIACRRYGGEVPEAGVLLLLFTPMAYVNVTSMWRFSNPWHRMVVSAAGMYAELFISFIALILWTRTDGLIANVAFNVFLMSSVTTVLFNANPLMRFDGYFLLSDLLAIPNLYTKGTKWFGDRLQHLLLGTPKTTNLCSSKELTAVAIYGSLAFFWKISISISLIIGAGVLFHGAGLMLSAFGVALWFGLPIFKQLKLLFGPEAKLTPSGPRMAVSAVALAATVTGMFGVLKAPATKSSPAIVQFAEETILRAQASGFIREVLVQDGEAVRAGDRLIVLDNPTLVNEVVELERLANEALIQSRIYQQQHEIALSQTELKKHQELTEQLNEKRAEAAGLQVTAPFDGFVFKRQLGNRVGSFAKRGDELLTVAQQRTKEVVVSIDQRDLESIQGNEGEDLRVALPGLTVFRSKLLRVNPRASLQPTHPSLCAHAGGVLPVRPAQTSDEQDGPRFELLAPRFNVVLELDEESSERVQSGQRGRAFFATCQQSLGSYLFLASKDWLETKIEIATQTAAF